MEHTKYTAVRTNWYIQQTHSVCTDEALGRVYRWGPWPRVQTRPFDLGKLIACRSLTPGAPGCWLVHLTWHIFLSRDNLNISQPFNRLEFALIGCRTFFQLLIWHVKTANFPIVATCRLAQASRKGSSWEISDTPRDKDEESLPTWDFGAKTVTSRGHIETWVFG